MTYFKAVTWENFFKIYQSQEKLIQGRISMINISGKTKDNCTICCVMIAILWAKIKDFL